LRKTTRLDKPTGNKYTGSFDEKSELDIPCHPVNGPVKLKKGETAPVKHPATSKCRNLRESLRQNGRLCQGINLAWPATISIA
jgi:hypothetical protein